LKEAYKASDMDTTFGFSHKQPPLYFRPGSGFFNSKMRSSLAKLGYKLVLGDVYPHDPQIHNPNVNARHVLSMARTGSVIICHDRRPWTAPMLDTVLEELVNKRGYTVTTISKLLEEGEKAKKAGHQVQMGHGKKYDDDDKDDKHVDGHATGKAASLAKNIADRIKDNGKDQKMNAKKKHFAIGT